MQAYFDWGYFSSCIRDDPKAAQFYLLRYTGWAAIDSEIGKFLLRLQSEVQEMLVERGKEAAQADANATKRYASKPLRG